MHHTLEQLPDPDALSRRAAQFVVAQAQEAVSDHGRFLWAVSGGRSPWAMFAELEHEAMPWGQITIYQVDERVAPEGDPDRNLTHLRQALKGAPAQIVPMAVEQPDLEKAAAEYQALLPERFDLIHLGLGPDGHTASLVPGDPVLAVKDALVGLTQPYQDRVRMTLTYPALSRTSQILWLVSGADKRTALAGLLDGDQSIPAGRVVAPASLVMADSAAL